MMLHSLTGGFLLPRLGFLYFMKGWSVVAYTGTLFSKEEQRELVIDAIAILLGDYSITRKYAAVLILKAFLPSKVRKAILEDKDIYPFKRGDIRVRRWTKQVLEKGRCEVCGATEDLEAHHIIKWADYPKGRADIKNGECLCLKCHTMRHREDGCFNMMKAKLSKKS